MGKVKILLESKPILSEDCPFITNSGKCRIDDRECHCLWGYYDSINFSFDKCPYCTVHRETVTYNE